jgi:cytochrome c553
MRNLSSLAFAIIALLVTPNLLADGSELIGACAHCHGTDGNSSSGQYPSLAKQNKEYIVKQLKDFKAGHRKNGQMSPMVGILEESDMVLLAAYYNDQNPAKQKGIDGELVKMGQKFAKELGCASCHKANYRGAAEIPRLARQKRVYLEKSMIDFRDGNRTNADGTKVDAMKTLTDEQIVAISHYLAGM